MEFRLLGPVELWAHGEQIPLPSTKVKLLYAALLWDAGRLVSTSVLIKRIWGDDAPPRELASLQSNASRLRKCLESCGDPTLKLTQISLGYRLAVPTECIDRQQFDRAVALARGAASRGDTQEAIRLLRSAEALVHGDEPLAGLVGRWAAETRAELEEQIREATVQRISLQTTLGETHAVLPELRRLAAKHEFDESILRLLMRTLHAAGRTSDALDAYTLFQARLREEKGLDPRAQLRKLHEELLRDESAPGKAAKPLVPAPAAPPSTLDRDPPGFVGRRRDIETITADIESQLATGVPVICGIDGMPGIGKTTLAVHIAHRILRLCPDGAFQLCLRAHDEQQSPTDPETALGLLLGMLGIEPGRIQRAASLDYLISLWRKHTAGKRMLLLLDDAADAEQIAPLVPSGAGNIVLVTARNRLTGLPEALRHALEPMPDADASALFVGAARMSPTSDPALRDVVAACGGFPMALAVAGNTLRTRQAWSIGDLAEHLANAMNSPARKPDSIISPLFRVFSTSYRDLPEFERMLLRRLSLSPGPRIHFRAAAALADADPGETDCALLNLVEKSLLKEPERRYYELHDMMRIFAAYACDVEENPAVRQAASDRLIRYTLGAVDAATRLFHPQRHVALVDLTAGGDARHDYGFSNAKQATAWLDAEKVWLRTVAEHWFANGHPEQAAALVHMISKFLDRRSLWKESIALHESALKAWRDAGNTTGEAHALTDLAAAHWRLGAYQAALERATEALRLWTGLASPNGMADALLQYGRVHYSTHHYAAAIESFTECLRLREGEHDPQITAVALHHLAVAQFDSGRYEEGITTAERALTHARSAHDVTIERNCINSLGEFRLDLGDYAGAETYCQQALLLADQAGDLRGVAVFALNLSECETFLHRPETALPLLDRALENFERLENVYDQANVMVAQARAHLELGRVKSATVLIDTAAEIAEQLSDPSQLARVQMLYGHLNAAAGSYQAAAEAFRVALDHAVAAGTPFLQASALRQLGDTTERVHGTAHARRHWLSALALYGSVWSPEAELLRERIARPYKGGAAA